MAYNLLHFNAILLQLYIIPCFIFQRFPSLTGRYFQCAYFSTTISSYIRGDAGLAMLCCLFARPLFALPAGLCLSCCFTRVYHISFVHIHTQTTLHMHTLHSVQKPLKHKTVEIWMHRVQDG
jgi:hypothetical protein